PISSRMTVRSTKPSPCPPYSSGKARPSQPRSAISFHSSGLYPRSSSIICRTNEGGQFSARKARAVCRNMSCSALKPKSMAWCPPTLQNCLLRLGVEEMDALHVEADRNFIVHLGPHLWVHTRREGVALTRKFQNDFCPQGFEDFHGGAEWGQIRARLLGGRQNIFRPDAKHHLFIRIGLSALRLLGGQRQAHALDVDR